MKIEVGNTNLIYIKNFNTNEIKLIIGFNNFII